MEYIKSAEKGNIFVLTKKGYVEQIHEPYQPKGE